MRKVDFKIFGKETENFPTKMQRKSSLKKKIKYDDTDEDEVVLYGGEDVLDYGEQFPYGWDYSSKVPAPVQIRQPRTTNKSPSDRLHLAVWNNDPGKVQKLVLYKAHFVDAWNSLGQTPLFVAAYTRKLAVTSLLLNLGADPNVRCVGGYTATHAACYAGSRRILATILKFGGDLEVHDVHRDTPLDWVDWQPDEKRRIRILDLLESVRLGNVRKTSTSSRSSRSSSASSSLHANEETGRALRLHHSRHSHSLRALSPPTRPISAMDRTMSAAKLHPEHTFTRRLLSENARAKSTLGSLENYTAEKSLSSDSDCSLTQSFQRVSVGSTRRDNSSRNATSPGTGLDCVDNVGSIWYRHKQYLRSNPSTIKPASHFNENRSYGHLSTVRKTQHQGALPVGQQYSTKSSLRSRSFPYDLANGHCKKNISPNDEAYYTAQTLDTSPKATLSQPPYVPLQVRSTVAKVRDLYSSDQRNGNPAAAASHHRGNHAFGVPKVSHFVQNFQPRVVVNKQNEGCRWTTKKGIKPASHFTESRSYEQVSPPQYIAPKSVYGNRMSSELARSHSFPYDLANNNKEKNNNTDSNNTYYTVEEASLVTASSSLSQQAPAKNVGFRDILPRSRINEQRRPTTLSSGDMTAPRLVQQANSNPLQTSTPKDLNSVKPAIRRFLRGAIMQESFNTVQQDSTQTELDFSEDGVTMTSSPMTPNAPIKQFPAVVPKKSHVNLQKALDASTKIRKMPAWTNMDMDNEVEIHAGHSSSFNTQDENQSNLSSSMVETNTAGSSEYHTMDQEDDEEDILEQADQKPDNEEDVPYTTAVVESEPANEDWTTAAGVPESGLANEDWKDWTTAAGVLKSGPANEEIAWTTAATVEPQSNEENVLDAGWTTPEVDPIEPTSEPVNVDEAIAEKVRAENDQNYDQNGNGDYNPNPDLPAANNEWNPNPDLPEADNEWNPNADLPPANVDWNTDPAAAANSVSWDTADEEETIDQEEVENEENYKTIVTATGEGWNESNEEDPTVMDPSSQTDGACSSTDGSTNVWTSVSSETSYSNTPLRKVTAATDDDWSRRASDASSFVSHSQETEDMYCDDELHPSLENDPNMQLVTAHKNANDETDVDTVEKYPDQPVLTDRDSILSMDLSGPQSLRSEYGEEIVFNSSSRDNNYVTITGSEIEIAATIAE